VITERRQRPRGQFRLLTYFALVSVWIFLFAALILDYLQTRQIGLVQQVQQQQVDFVRHIQGEFATKQDSVARRDLLLAHQEFNQNIARVLLNLLWKPHLQTLIEAAQRLSDRNCQANPGPVDTAETRVACERALGARLRSMSSFSATDARVFAAMGKTSVFKLKLYDLTGLTVYSSDHAQIGESKVGNAGWRSAALEAKVMSEVTHRDRFSSFEGMVENRDVISSYLPVQDPTSGKVVAVFEVYADVTGAVALARGSAADMRAMAARNQREVEDTVAANTATLDAQASNNRRLLLIMLLLMFFALGLIVRRADNIVRSRDAERERSQQQLSQTESMAQLGQMVAGVSHQLNTPIAFSRNNVSMVMDALRELEAPVKVAQSLAEVVERSEGDRISLNVSRSRPQLQQIAATRTDIPMLRAMLGDTLSGLEQMRELVENLRNFTRLDRAHTTVFNVNECLHNVIYLIRSVAPPNVVIEEYLGDVPSIEGNPSQLNQACLNLINNGIQAIEDAGTVSVRSTIADGRVRVDVTDTGKGIAPDILPQIFDIYFTTKSAEQGTGLGLPIAKTIVEAHGGEIRVESWPGRGTSFSILLPAAAK
jgi:signal transduction histidine kinase